MSLLLTIEGALSAGAIAGILIGFWLPFRKAGCLGLVGVPLAMIGYISWWQGQNSDLLRSTSGLDFLFGPIWPSVGALAGYFVGSLLGERWVERGD